MDHAATVEEAVKRFYTAGTSDAHSWLLQVQASPEAWTFVWDLLNPSKSWEVQFFGATTLYTKVSKQWEEVPQSEYGALRDRIIECVKRTDSPLLVLSKLCQALAAVLVNMQTTSIDTSGKNFVNDLIGTMRCDTPLALDLLLRVLSALPGEFETRQSIRKTILREGLTNSWSRVTSLLLDVFSTCDHDVAARDNQPLFLLALECTLCWLKFPGQLQLETTSHIYNHLLRAALQYAPRRESESDASGGWETVQECLILTITHPELHKRPSLLWGWSEGLVWVARQEGGRAFYEILSALGESHSRAFLLALTGEGDEKQRWTSKQLIELLLECSELPGRYPTDERNSSIPFGFWYALQDDLTTLDPPPEAQALLALKPVYARLAQALLRKATLPPSPAEAGDDDEQELLRCYRQDAADTLAYCYNVLGGELLRLLGQRLGQSSERFEAWIDVESTLHAFKALAESVGTQETRYIPPLMDVVLSQIPYDRYPSDVLSSACTAVGAYAEWIGEHPDPWLEAALGLVSLGLARGSTTAPAASMALKDLARECGPHLAPLAPSVLETIGMTLPTVAAGGGEGLRLMYAAGKLLNSLPSTEAQIQHLDSTLGPCVRRLHELLRLPAAKVRVAVANQLKMATMLFTTLEGPVSKAVLDGLMPLFNQIVADDEWGKDATTLEAMHNCAQRSVSSLVHPKTDARQLLPLLVTSYKTRPHPAALNLLRQLVLCFGRESCNVVAPAFAELNGYTLNGVAATRAAGGNLSDLSDLLEAYLSLLAQICKKNARMLLHVPHQISETLQCGIACLALPETGAAKAAGSFLTHAIGQSPHFQTFIQPIGQELVCMIVRCVAGDVARSSLDPHAEVLLTLNKTCSEWTAQWLRIALTDLTATSVAQEQKDSFSRAVLRECSNKRRMCEILKEFSLTCRQATSGL